MAREILPAPATRHRALVKPAAQLRLAVLRSHALAAKPGALPGMTGSGPDLGDTPGRVRVRA